MKFQRYNILLLSFFSHFVWSSTCGRVQTNDFVPKEFLSIVIFGHNGDAAGFPADLGPGLGSSKPKFVNLKLAPGWHQFQGFAVCGGLDGEAFKTQALRKLCSKPGLTGRKYYPIDFSLYVEAGKSYKVAAKPLEEGSLNHLQPFTTEIVKTTERDCNEPGKPALTLSEEQLAALMSDEVMAKTDQLALEIRDLYTQIGYANKVVLTQRPNITNPLLGVVYTNQSKGEKGIKVNAITPHSVSSVLGIEGEDILIAIGDFTFNHATESVEQMQQRWARFITSIKPGSSLLIKVIRNNSETSWTVSSSPLFTPANEISIEAM